MAIDRKTVEKVATLARLKLTPEELAVYEKQLGAILDYIAKLETLDVAGLEPLAHPAEASNVFRDDVVKPSLPRTEALKNAPERNDDFFIVPKVVE
ncbi:MAG TPA: Asp-tRNA(Asn)/Glu-tRNA(Gln) amidotransferase subunit GatC [Planctomycetota bacterium]